MGRKTLFSAMLVAGLSQMEPVLAQVQDQQQDIGSAPASAKPVWIPSVRRAKDGLAQEAPRRSAQVVEAAPAPAPAVKVTEEAPRPQAVMAEVRPRQPDLADQDLAVVPPEEAKPLLIDPTAVRRGLASAGPHALPAREAAEPAQAAAEPVERRLPAPRAHDPEVIQAERVVASAQERAEGEPVREAAPEAVVASREAAPLPERVPTEPEPVLAAVESAPEPAEEVGGDTALARAERVASSEPPVALPEPGGDSSLARTARAAASRTVRAVEERAPRPVYADEEHAPRPRYDERGIDTRPVYADDDRDIAARPRYAMVEPGLRPADRPWADRGSSRDCDEGRAYRLQQRLRRAVRDGAVDWRAAQDIEDDIGYVDNMHRTYCVSGMTDWREERLDREYAEIEDRLRFEENFNRRD